MREQRERLQLSLKRKRQKSNYFRDNVILVPMHFRMGILFLVTTLFVIVPGLVYAETATERRARLEFQLSQIESQIREQQVYLNDKQKERTTLERDVAIIDAQINKAQLSIRARDLSINELQSQAYGKENEIGVLNVKVAAGQESLAQLIRLTREGDDTSLVELVLSGTFADFFNDLDAFATLQEALGNSFEEMASLKDNLTESRSALLEQKTEQQSLRSVQVLEKQSIEVREKEKKKVLDITKGQEAAYQKLIASQQKDAAVIRSALFAFRDSAAIPFGKAYDFAIEASTKTGVRPALILAILKQETNLGENVGQCLLTNSPNKGDGKGKNTGRFFSQVMKGSRDVDPFLQVVAELGLDPFSQVVSCPPSYGYGGAMGPAQFIPSTWVLYKERLANATGQKPPNPWEPRTAIFATALLMKDNGADRGSYASERLAALRYFAGWRNANKSAYAFYGDDVMEIATKLQKQIDVIEGR